MNVKSDPRFRNHIATSNMMLESTMMEMRHLLWFFFLHGDPRHRQRIIRAFWRWSGRTQHLRRAGIDPRLAMMVTADDVARLAQVDRLRLKQYEFGRRMFSKLRAQGKRRESRN